MDENLLVLRTLKACTHDKNKQFEIKIKIGKPYWVEEGLEAACPFALDGLYGQQPDIRGIDFFDALKNAILLAERLLSGALDEYLVYWPNDEPFEM